MVNGTYKSLKEIQITEPYLAVCQYIEETLEKHGYEAWLVGGSVRDLLIEGKLSDLDYTTNALPEKVQKIFPRTVPVGIKFGTILVLYKGQKVEVTTFRADADYADGRRPSKVEYAQNLATDIKRRDFTVNGLAYSVRKKELKDYCDGLADLERKILRTIGDPVARFTEDGLRPIRGCRIAAKLGFQIETKTLAAMKTCIDVTAKVAPERFFDEWRKTLRLKNKRAFWENLLSAGIVGAFLPDIVHFFDASKSTVLMRELNQLHLRTMADYAASVFYLLGVRDLPLVKRTLLDTRFPTAEIKLCITLLHSQLFDLKVFDRQDIKATLSRIRKSERVTHVRFFTAMRSVTMRAEKRTDQEVLEFWRAFRAHYRSIRRSREPLDIADLAVTGTDIEDLGLKGRAVGEALERLRDAVVKEPGLNEKTKLIELLKSV